MDVGATIYMRKAGALALIITVIACLLISSGRAWAAAEELRGPNVKVLDKSIVVSASLKLSEQQSEEIRKGVGKVLVFYIDLFRDWGRWPDEFVLGKKISRTLHCDPVKNEYFVLSQENDGNIQRKRFSDCDKLLAYSLYVNDVQLTNIPELEEAEYFVRAKVESRIRQLPPFIDVLFFFVKEHEFQLVNDSPSFPLKPVERKP